MDGIILLLLALVLIYTVGLGGDDDNHWNRGGGCFAYLVDHYFMPKCEYFGFCREKKSCGRKGRRAAE